MAAVERHGSFKDRNWDNQLDSLLDDLQRSVSPHQTVESVDNTSGPYGVIQKPSSVAPHYTRKYHYYGEKSYKTEKRCQSPMETESLIRIQTEQRDPQRDEISRSNYATDSYRELMKGKTSRGSYTQRSFRSDTDETPRRELDGRNVRNVEYPDTAENYRSYRQRMTDSMERSRGRSLERYRDVEFKREYPYKDAEPSRGRSLDVYSRDDDAGKKRFYSESRERRIEHRSYSSKKGSESPEHQSSDVETPSRRRESPHARNVIHRSLDRSSERHMAGDQPGSSSRYFYEERHYPPSPLPNPRLKQNIRELDDLLHGLNNTKQKEVIDRKGLNILPLSLSLAFSEMYTTRIKEDIPIGHSTPLQDRDREGHSTSRGQVDIPDLTEQSMTFPDTYRGQLDDGVPVTSSKRIYKQYRYDWSSVTKRTQGADRQDHEPSKPSVQFPDAEQPRKSTDRVQIREYESDTSTKRRSVYTGTDDIAYPCQERKPDAKQVDRQMAYHPPDAIKVLDDPCKKSQEIPKHVDELLASISDSESYSKPATKESSISVQRDDQVRASKLSQLSPLQKTKSYEKDDESLKEDALSPPMSGPCVYYPPSFGETLSPEANQGQMKEGWESKQMGKGKGRAKGKGKYSQMMKAKGSEKKGAVAVPLCLPLCCAAPLCCTVM